MSATPPRKTAWWKAALLSIGGGLLTALAFPPFDVGGLVWVGLLPLLTALWLGPRGKRRGFTMGWLYGMAYFSTCFHWIMEVGEVWGIPTPVFLLVAYIPLMAFYSCIPGIWGAFAGSVLRPALRPAPDTADATPAAQKEAWAAWRLEDMCSTLRCAFGLGALWVCLEWLRANGPLACSWNGFGLALYDGLSLAQWAEFVGTNALSFLPVATAVVLWCTGRRVWMNFHGTHQICRPWDFYGTLLIIFGLFMGGLQLSQAYSPASMFGRESVMKLPVVALQRNTDQSERLASTVFSPSAATRQEYCRALTEGYVQDTGACFEAILRATFELAMSHPGEDVQQMPPAWVIWPESAVGASLWQDTRTGVYLADDDILWLLESLQGLREAEKAVGGPGFVLFTGADEILVDPQANKICGMRNSLVVIPEDPAGMTSAAKQHLMPFGEYIPLVQDIEWIGQIYSQITGTQVGDGLTPGEGTEPLTVPVPGTEETVQVIPAICYEDSDGALLRRFARPGAQVIVNNTNDAWFRNSVCGMQQARSAAFRCIELRRPMVRAANRGLCCTIAPNGGIINALYDKEGDYHTAGHCYGILPVDRNAPMTIYALLGEWAVWVCLLIAIALSIPGSKVWSKPAATTR